MRARLVGLVVLVLLSVALVGCGSSSTGLPGGGDPPAEVDTVTVGTLSVGVASAAGLKTMTLPSSGPVAFTAVYGTEIVRLQELRRGTQIVFRGDPGTGPPDLFVMNADGSAVVNLTSSPAGEYYPAWSPDGKKIAYHSNEGGDNEIWVMNADGSDKNQITNNSVHDLMPAWSPDGGKLAISQHDGVDREIVVMNADGSGATTLTDDALDSEQPAWSPDGSRIAYSVYNGANWDIRVMFADGTSPLLVGDSADNDRRPAWSPDGSKIAYAVDGSAYEIYTMNPDGSSKTALTNTAALLSDPAWSPDGTQLACVYRQDPDRAISVMNADGSGMRPLTTAPTDEAQPAWCPAPGVWRTLIGKEASDGGFDPPLGPGSRPCVIAGIQQGGMASTATVTMSRAHWGSLDVEALTGLGTGLAGAKLTGANIKNLKEDMGRGIPALVWNMRETPVTGAVLVFLNVDTGRIETVLALADEALAGDAAATASGRIVLRGEFTDVLTAADPSRNLATDSAREVVLDSDTGEVVGVN